jgi:hypothetical protein
VLEVFAAKCSVRVMAVEIVQSIILLELGAGKPPNVTEPVALTLVKAEDSQNTAAT